MPEQFCPPAWQTPRTHELPEQQSELRLQRPPVDAQPVVLQTRLEQVRPPQQSAVEVHVWPGPMQAERQRVLVEPATAPHTGALSQHPPAAKPEVQPWSAQPAPVRGSQRPRRQERPSQQSVSAPQELPSFPQMPRHAFPARLPLAMQYGASAQHPPCAKPWVQME